MTAPQSIENSRSVPMIGFLCLMAGFGVFFSVPNVAEFCGPYRDVVRLAGTVIGSLLILWGLRLVALRFGDRPGRAVGRLNRNRVMLPREGIAYLVIMIVAFIGSLIGRSNMLMLVFSIMAGPFIVNGGIAFTMLKRNRLGRRLSSRAMAGEVVPVEISLVNRKWWFASWMMVVRDRVGHETRPYSGSVNAVLTPAVLFASVRPRREQSVCYQLRVTKRGRYVFGPLVVATRFPLGLVERGFVTDVRGEMLVYPQIGTLTSAWHRQFQFATNFVERLDTSRGTFQDEFHHLRSYRPGDNPRDIHWRTSARVNGLMVREFHQCRERDLAVILDLWQPSRASTADRDWVELALSFVATICVDHLRRAQGVEQMLFVAGATAMNWRSNRGTAGLESLLDILAIVEPGESRELAHQIDQSTRMIAPTARVVFVTTRLPGAELAEAAGLRKLPGVETIHVRSESLTRYFSLESPLVGELEPVAELAGAAAP